MAAALRPMLSIVREETAVLGSELASAASAGRVAIGESAVGGAGRVAAEMNPLAVRQAIEAGVKESAGGGMGLKQALEVSAKDAGSTTLLSRQAVEATLKDGAGESILSQHLSLAPNPPSSLLKAHPNFSTTTSSTQSIISSTIEENMGQTLKEVLGNAGQTGVEEQMDQVVEVAKVLAKSGIAEGSAGGAGGVTMGVEEAAREIGIKV